MTPGTDRKSSVRKAECAAVLITRAPRFALGLLVLFSCTSTVGATCWEAAGARYGIHPWLLAAIAKVESGFDPRAVNGTHAEQTGTVDLGLMQINSSWLPRLARHGITRERLFDACTSVTVAAWILADLFARHGLSWEAVGAYNASCARLEPLACGERRGSYARKVEAALRELAAAGSVALSPIAPQRIVQVRVGGVAAPSSHHETRVGE